MSGLVAVLVLCALYVMCSSRRKLQVRRSFCQLRLSITLDVVLEPGNQTFPFDIAVRASLDDGRLGGPGYGRVHAALHGRPGPLSTGHRVSRLASRAAFPTARLTGSLR